MRAVDEALHALVGTAVLRYTGVLRTVEDLVLTRYSTSKDSANGNAPRWCSSYARSAGRTSSGSRCPRSAVDSRRRTGAAARAPAASTLSNITNWLAGRP